jgi:spore maturation protein CgeB
MKILLVSSFRTWELGASYLRAFQTLGHAPACFDMSREYEKSYTLTRNRYTQILISPFIVRKVNERLLTLTRDIKPDLVFVHKGKCIKPETLEQIKSDTGAVIMNFNPDDPFNKNRGASSNLIRDSIGSYDAYFIWSKSLIPKLRQAGAKAASYLPFAADEALHCPVGPDATGNQNNYRTVTFVGNWDEAREQWLSKLRGIDLHIWGTDYWSKRCRTSYLQSCWQGRAVFGSEMSKIIRSSGINLNILRRQNKGSHNMRTFEIPACGGFMLHERSEEVRDFFEEGKEIACFSSSAELAEKVDYYLSRDELRNDMARNSHSKVREHTYTGRAQRVLDVYGEIRRN